MIRFVFHPQHCVLFRREEENLISSFLYTFVTTFKQYCNCPSKTEMCITHIIIVVKMKSQCVLLFSQQFLSQKTKLFDMWANLSLRNCIPLSCDIASIIHILSYSSILNYIMLMNCSQLQLQQLTNSYQFCKSHNFLSILHIGYTGKETQSKCTKQSMLSIGRKPYVIPSVMKCQHYRVFVLDKYFVNCTNIFNISLIHYQSPWRSRMSSHLQQVICLQRENSKILLCYDSGSSSKYDIMIV